jgi:hypothetical protein
VLLVDDDQAEVGEGREDRRARAHAHAGLAAAHPPPLVVALARGEAGVHDGDGVAEALHEAAGRLRRERDLWNEDDRRVAPFKGRGDRAQVDLGLAAAGDAVQEERAAGAGVREARDDRLERRALRSRGLDRSRAGAHAVDGRPPRRLRGILEADESASLETAHRRVVGAGVAGYGGDGGRPRREGVEHRGLAAPEAGVGGERRSPVFGQRRPQRPLRPQRPSGPRAGPGRQHQRQAARRRGDVLARHPEAEPHERLRHVRLERRHGLHQALGRDLALLGQRHHHAEQPPPAERHHEHAPHPHALERPGEPVVEGAAQGAGRRQRLDLGDHGTERTRAPGRARLRRDL